VIDYWLLSNRKERIRKYKETHLKYFNQELRNLTNVYLSRSGVSDFVCESGKNLRCQLGRKRRRIIIQNLPYASLAVDSS